MIVLNDLYMYYYYALNTLRWSVLEFADLQMLSIYRIFIVVS